MIDRGNASLPPKAQGVTTVAVGGGAMSLSLSMPQEQFNECLLQTYGIKANKLPIDQVVKAAKSGGTAWHDVCDAWEKTPQELAGLRGLLLVLKKQADPPVPAEPRVVSPNTSRQFGTDGSRKRRARVRLGEDE